MEKQPTNIIKFSDAVFAEQGYIVVRRLVPKSSVKKLSDLAAAALDPLAGPAEFEAQVGYPGAPASRSESGGLTPRRLLHAISRDSAFAQLATAPSVLANLKNLMGTKDVLLSQNHHNCIMTKHPGYSSSTSWHQDIRYWSFDKPSLVSMWVALGKESVSNGALSVIPGSHTETVPRGRLDRDLFLRTDLPANHAMLASQVQIELDPGDVLFFHCRLFHSARRNTTKKVKLSAVFTYHSADNHPIPGTRSDLYPSIELNENRE